jgi:hypothetical protein
MFLNSKPFAVIFLSNLGYHIMKYLQVFLEVLISMRSCKLVLKV